MFWFFIIGIIAGWLAGKLDKGGGFSLFGDMVVGVAGSFIGGYWFGILGFSAPGTIGRIITATIGAVLLLWIIRYWYSLMKLHLYNMIVQHKT